MSLTLDIVSLQENFSGHEETKDLIWLEKRGTAEKTEKLYQNSCIQAYALDQHD